MSEQATFEGFPVAALDFYDDLEMDNTRSFWEAHKHLYAEQVRAPMAALTAALEPEFGTPKIFRPYRDVRFAKDKTPYKTHQGAFVAVAPRTGFYVQVGAPGVRVGAGCYATEPADLARIRASIDERATGTQLEGVLAELAAEGYDVRGDRLKTSPRGYSVDHPRIDLLRYKSLFVGRDYGFEPFVHTPDLLERVRADWTRMRPVVDWLAERVGE